MPLPLLGFFHGHAIAQLDHSPVCAVCSHRSNSAIEELLSASLGASKGRKLSPALKSVMQMCCWRPISEISSMNAAGQPPVCAVHNGHEYAPKSLIDLHIGPCTEFIPLPRAHHINDLRGQQTMHETRSMFEAPMDTKWYDIILFACWRPTDFRLIGLADWRSQCWASKSLALFAL